MANIPSPPSYVLVTGANGFLGAALIQSLLDKKLRVRGTVRSQQRVDELKTAFAEYDGTRLDYAIVPDITASGAYDEAVQGGIDGIIHTTSPLVPHFAEGIAATGNAKSGLDSAIEAARGIVSSAVKNGTVKHLVLTSSAAALTTSWVDERNTTLGASDYGKATYEEIAASDNAMLAYTASKALAEKAAWATLKAAGNPFRLTTILPGATIGSARVGPPSVSTPGIAFHFATSKSTADPVTKVPAAWLSWVTLPEIVEAHIAALLTPSSAGKRYVMAGRNVTNSELRDILLKSVPGAKSENTVEETFSESTVKWDQQLALDELLRKPHYDDIAPITASVFKAIATAQTAA
ncbi:3-beta hydroxysteroid dehydrogenase isomerase family protein [Ceraceosorus bombacis]|uniref:3-beta hydroxysteroid dehydrogenase isomerase family protein n=1 Tax=Ceraceosorus bombacis TaxID=401625 RepID=A0A0P1B9V3_9BASI|nr:3-beta hydroxysteroid dehydrogenase isomerase family protein [Ceraceosorus bombacis]